jgi:glycosidase
VFNHVGRGFWAFQDVLKNRQNSQYASWFHINWDSNSSFNDGFDYRGWENHQNLVALNHENPDVTHYLFDCISFWQNEFGIDGIRLDVAYCLPDHFIQKLRAFCGNLFLIGEIIHGDYNCLLGPAKLHSVTNYQLHKSLWSSFNDLNMFEAAYTLDQHFGITAGAYKGTPLLNFVDNHDVNRSASVIKNPAHLKPLYALLFSAPGIPCIYYGSEWGAQGARDAFSDDALRPFFEAPQHNELTEYIGRLSALRKEHARTFAYGTYKQLACIYGGQLVFERVGFFEGNKQERVIVAVNASDHEYFFNYNLGTNSAIELISGNTYSNLSNGFAIPPYTALYLLLS